MVQGEEKGGSEGFLKNGSLRVIFPFHWVIFKSTDQRIREREREREKKEKDREREEKDRKREIKQNEKNTNSIKNLAEIIIKLNFFFFPCFEHRLEKNGKRKKILKLQGK